MRRRWFSMVLAVVAVASLWLDAGRAAAHSDDGTITAVGPDRVSGPTVRVEATITFNSDGHVAPTATATVVAERAGADTVGPVPLKRDPAAGSYTASIKLTPGTWTLRYTSLSPTAVLERIVTVDVPPSSTITTSTAAPAGTTTTLVGSISTAGAAASTTTPTPVASASGTPASGGGDTAGTTVLFVGLIVVIAAGGVLIAARARRPRGGA